MAEIDNYRPHSGRFLREDGSVVNLADYITVDGEGKLRVSATVTAEIADSKVKGSTDAGATPEGWVPLKVGADGTLQVQLSGSLMELFGASVAARPDVAAVPVGCTFTLLDGTFDTWISNGTTWEAI